MNLYHGVDLVDINRKEFKNKILYLKILHPQEAKIYLSLDSLNQIRYLASRWAIKEALFKALPIKLAMVKMNIEYHGEQPIFNLDGYLVSISLTYEKNWVLASTVIIKQ